jgi:hypothetical protein
LIAQQEFSMPANRFNTHQLARKAESGGGLIATAAGPCTPIFAAKLKKRPYFNRVPCF